MVDKALIYNIALSALRSNYRTTDPDNDVNKAVKLLKDVYPLALAATLEDLDLNKTSTKVKLQLLDKEHPHWEYVYRYPSTCLKFRKIVSPYPVDNKETKIPCATEIIDNLDVILTNEAEAYADVIPSTINLSNLNANAAFALGYQMAIMSPSQIIGKGSIGLRQSLFEEYRLYKAKAQATDVNENVDITPDEFESSFIQARTGGRRWPTRI